MLTVALVTFRVTVPEIEVVGSVAVMVALPAKIPFAKPTLVIVATVSGVDAQVTVAVILRSPPSL